MKYIKIDKEDYNNGDGIRVVLWLSNCQHKCKGCHNPQTWNENNGDIFTAEDESSLLSLLKQSHIKGLTLSGGDPMESYDDVLKLCMKVKKELPDKDIWMWTGYTVDEIRNNGKSDIFNYIDYIIDGKFEIEKYSKTLKYRGSSNQKRYKCENGYLAFID